MVDQNLLGNEVQPAGGREPLGVERSIRLAELHQVDARQVAGRVVEEHVLAARVTGIDSAAVGAGVPVVDRRVVLHARVAAVPGTVGHPVEHLASLIRRTFCRVVGHPAGGPLFVLLDCLHEVVGHANRQVGVLEHHRAVGFAIEVGFVLATGNQRLRFLLFLPLALDELHDVRVPHFDRLHLGGTARLATAFDDRGDLVVNPHERERSTGHTTAGELFALAPQGREVGAGARTKLEQHRLASCQAHDVFHVVRYVLDEAGRTLGELVRILGLGDLLRGGIPSPVALVAPHAVLVVQADVEPHRRVKRPVLVQAEPREVAIETLAIGGRSEIAVFEAPVGDRTGDAVYQLADAILTLRRADLAVEVLAANDVGGQLAPEARYLAVVLLEQHLAFLAFDLRGAYFPVDRLEHIVHFGGAEGRVDLQAAVKRLGGCGGGWGRGTGIDSSHEK